MVGIDHGREFQQGELGISRAFLRKGMQVRQETEQ